MTPSTRPERSPGLRELVAGSKSRDIAVTYPLTHTHTHTHTHSDTERRVTFIQENLGQILHLMQHTGNGTDLVALWYRHTESDEEESEPIRSLEAPAQQRGTASQFSIYPLSHKLPFNSAKQCTKICF